jgi:hypothetical protein
MCSELYIKLETMNITGGRSEVCTSWSSSITTVHKYETQVNEAETDRKVLTERRKRGSRK